MRIEKIKAAEAAAREFLRRAKAARKANTRGPYLYAPRESGALRRQSIELAQALVELRRP